MLNEILEPNVELDSRAQWLRLTHTKQMLHKVLICRSNSLKEIWYVFLYRVDKTELHIILYNNRKACTGLVYGE